MIIFVQNWKKKIIQVLTLLVMIAAFAIALPAITGMLHDQVPTLGNRYRDEHPTGNPMRVEEEQSKSDKWGQAVDQFVIKLQDFYYEE